MVKNPPANTGYAGDTGLIPGSGRSPGVGNGNLIQYSCLENSIDRGSWQATVHGVAQSQTSEAGKVLMVKSWTSVRDAIRILGPFLGGSDEESACNEEDLGLIPGLGRSPGEGNGYPFQYSGLENFIDRGAWQATVHAVTNSWT